MAEGSNRRRRFSMKPISSFASRVIGLMKSIVAAKQKESPIELVLHEKGATDNLLPHHTEDIHINDVIHVDIDAIVPDQVFLAMSSQVRDKGKEMMDEYIKISGQKKVIGKILISRMNTSLHDDNKSLRAQLKFLEYVVNTLDAEDLKELHSETGNTPLHTAAILGFTTMVEAITSKGSKLTEVPDKDGNIPLVVAASNLKAHNQKEIVEHLCDLTPNECPEIFANVTAAGRLICSTIDADHFDTAYRLIKKFPRLAVVKDDTGSCALEVLAQRPFAFPSGSWLTPWQRIKYSAIQVDLDTHEPRDGSQYVDNSLNSDLEKGKVSDLDSHSQPQGFSLRRFHKALGLTHAYKEKLMHRQAQELLNCTCRALQKALLPTETSDDDAIVDNKTEVIKDEQRVLDFFESTSILSSAASSGAVEIVEECIQVMPELVKLNMEKQSPLAVAIGHRTDRIYNLILKMTGENKDKFATFKDKNGNTLLHLAAKLAPSTRQSEISGPALRMQRELQWFKEVEGYTPQKDKLIKNCKGMTARELFTKEHRKLMKQGEEWMQRTAHSCMIVATLVTTVLFAAAFTVPGGNHSDSKSEKDGTPIFLYSKAFVLFLASDAAGLFSSLTSVISFLSILTSSYTENDFLKSLPRKLIFGLLSLFLAIIAMMIAFSAALSIILGHRFSWFPVFITVTTCVLSITYAIVQLPLFIEMVRATYWPKLIRGKSTIAKIIGHSGSSHKHKRI